VLRSILVALDGSPWSEAATTLAFDWADRFDAHVLGLGVLDEPTIERGEPVPLGAYEYKKHRDERRLEDAHRRVLAFLDDFRARAAAAGLTAIALEDIGDPAERVLREAHRCDVVVLGRETHFHFETQDKADATLARVIRTSPARSSSFRARCPRVAASWSPMAAAARLRARCRRSSSWGSPRARMSPS
jgi:nucleotide-binding universal stress UspA family protein